MISGDKLYDLDAPRLDILKKVLPSIGKAARSIDLFEKAEPELFLVSLEGRWLLACFNWKSSPAQRDIDLTRLGLSAEKTYLLHEFWSQRLAEAHGTIHISLDPTSVQLFAIQEKHDHPQIVGTDRHFSQGDVELSRVSWDPKSKTLSGVALGKPAMNWTISVHVPGGFRPVMQATTGLSDVLYQTPLLRGRVNFEKADLVNWSCTFE